jgi:hypothetical protein
VFAAFRKFQTHSTQWFHGRADNQSSIRTLHSSSSARWVSPSRIADLRKLGALCALLMILGQAPCPLGPGIFQFITHGCDLHALHPAFVGEWHPDLRRMVMDWIQMGPDGDVAPFEQHFITWHDFEVCGMTTRINSAIVMNLTYTFPPGIIAPWS